jgi:hypothetical protein
MEMITLFGTVTITLLGILFGTSVQLIMATDGDEAGIMTTVAGNELTNERGTATGELHEVGTMTVSGKEILGVKNGASGI